MSYKVLFNSFSDSYNETHGWENDATLWLYSSEEKRWFCHSENEDVYDLITDFSVYGYLDKSILVTHGWAAPYDQDENIPPSQHEYKKRVRLFLYLEQETLVNAYILMGESLHEVSENCQGLMADAVRTNISKIKSYVKNQNSSAKEVF